MKKQLTIIIAILMVLTLLSGCGGNPTLASIAIDEVAPLAVGADTPLNLTYAFEGNVSEEAQQKAREGLLVAYTSLHPDIATVDENGTIKGVGKGTTTITVSVGEVSAQTTVNVYVPLEDMDTGESAVQLAEGESYAITAKPLPEGADLENVRFTSSDEAIIKVSATGEVMAVGDGSATVRVACREISKTITFEIVPQIESIDFADGNTEGLLYVGVQHQLVPIVEPADIAADFAYASDNESVCSVDENGLLSVKSAGVAVITVSVAGYPDIAAEYIVTVTNRPASGGSGSGNRGSAGSGGTVGTDGATGSGNTGGGGTPTQPTQPTNPSPPAQPDPPPAPEPPVEVPYDPGNIPDVVEQPEW